MTFLTLMGCVADCPDAQSDEGHSIRDTSVTSVRSTTSDWDGWVAASAGLYQTCVLDYLGHVYCFGCEPSGDSGDDSIQSEACISPPGLWDSISTGMGQTCATAPNGTLCIAGPQSPVPLAKVALGTNSNCGIGTDGMAVCWADGYLSPSSVAPSIAFSAIATGTLHHCGIKSDDDSVVCWGDRAEQPPPGPFMAVDGKTDFLCGLTDIGVECWGRNPLPSVEGSWDALTVGNEHACAYTATDYHCWGDTEFGPTGPIESGILLMDAGYRHTCAIRGDGRAECWGYTGNGAVFPP